MEPRLVHVSRVTSFDALFEGSTFNEALHWDLSGAKSLREMFKDSRCVAALARALVSVLP